MSSTPTQRPSDPRQLEVLIQELEARYTELFQFIELSVRADPETEASQAMAFERQIAELFEEMRAEVNGQLSTSSRLARVLERREPFTKTATHKIKRYLYSADTMHM